MTNVLHLCCTLHGVCSDLGCRAAIAYALVVIVYERLAYYCSRVYHPFVHVRRCVCHLKSPFPGRMAPITLFSFGAHRPAHLLVSSGYCFGDCWLIAFHWGSHSYTCCRVCAFPLAGVGCHLGCPLCSIVRECLTCASLFVVSGCVLFILLFFFFCGLHVCWSFLGNCASCFNFCGFCRHELHGSLFLCSSHPA